MDRYTKVHLFYTVCEDVCQTMCTDVKTKNIRDYIRSQLKELKTRGVSEFIKVGKGHYNIAIRIAMGQPFTPLNFRKSDKKGIPKALSSLKKYLLSGDPKQVRAVLTLLRAVYHLETHINPQVDSIVTPSQVDVETLPWFNDFVEFSSNWAKPFKVSSTSWSTSDLHVTTKAGPSGLAMVNSVNDLYALMEDKQLFMILKRYLKVTNQLALLSYLGYLYVQHQDAAIVPSRTLSKLAFLSEGGGKTRTIAIADYWSQCALKSLHKELMGKLRKMQTDGTYDQNRLALSMRNWTETGRSISCFDLTTATDRFPVVLQQVVIQSMSNESVAAAWRMLLTERIFSSTIGDVKYAVGQPMGMLSSWAAFAVTHHVIIEFCAKLEGLSNFRDYIVLGDDVAIVNDKVSKRYRKVLSDLEVPISKDKSIISAEGLHSCGEIAKRLFLRGNEISPIPPDLIRSARKNKYLFVPLVREYQIRSGDCRLQPWAQLAQRWFPKDHTELQIFLTVPPGYPGSLFKDRESWMSESASFSGGWYSIFTQDPERVTKAYQKERITSLEEKMNLTMRQTFKILGKEEVIEGESHYQVLFSKIFKERLAKLGLSIPDSSEKEIRTPLLLTTAKYIQDLFDLRDRIHDGEIKGDLDEKEYIPDVFAAKYFRTKQQYRSIVSSQLTIRVFEETHKSLTGTCGL